MAAATKPRAAKKTEEAKPSGPTLYEAVLAAARKAIRRGEFVAHKNGLYTRLQLDGRTVAYIVRGKKSATVYPNTLAANAPEGLKYKTVELGSHHYGRGEIMVAVSSPDDVANAVAMLKASLSMPAVPRSERAAATAEA